MENMNKNLSLFVMIFLQVFIFYASIEHIIDLTKFTFKYSYAFDYGKFIKALCLSEYFESETERFQIVTNADDIKFSNTTNKNRYSLFILIMSIFVCLYISMSFGVFVSSILINNNWIDKALGIKKSAYRGENMFYQVLHTMQEIINRIVAVFMKIFEKPSLQPILMTVFLIFVHIIVLLCFIIVPIYLGLKLGIDYDMSPLQPEEYPDIEEDTNSVNGTYGRVKKRYDRFQNVMNFIHNNAEQLPTSNPIAAYVLYALFFTTLILLRFGYYIQKNEKYELLNMMSTYFSENENIMTTNSMFGYALYFMYIGVFVCVFYILGNSISLFRKTKNEKESTGGTLYGNIYGYTEYNNLEGRHLVKKSSGLMFTILIILLVLIATYLFIPFDVSESDILRYQIILPLSFLVIIMFVVANFTEYNTFANIEMIEKPCMHYKQYIGTINPLFNKILASEYKDKSESVPGYACQNVINSVYVTLCSHLFNKFDGIKTSDESNSRLLDMTPVFHYTQSCQNNLPFQFHSQKEYKISYYLHNKSLNKNIFYDNKKCSQINSAIVQQMQNNLRIFDDNDDDETNIVQNIREMSIKNIDNVKFLLGDKYGKSMDRIKDKLTKTLYTNIKNVLSGNVSLDSNKKFIYYDSSKNKYFKENNEMKLNDIEIFNHNNKLVVFEDINVHKTNDEDYKKYKIFIEEIVAEYMDVIVYHLYALAISSSDMSKYVEVMSKGIQNSFESVQKIMTSPIGKHDSKLTNYIISNYNSLRGLRGNNIYSDSFFQHIKQNPSDKNDTMIKSIKTLKTVIAQTKKIVMDLNTIILSFNENSTISTLQVFTKVNDIRDQINIVTNDLRITSKKTEPISNDLKIFTNDINMIYETDINYITEYKYVDIKTEVSKNVEINENMVDMVTKMFELCTATCNEIIQMNELLPLKEIDTEIVVKCKQNLKTFANVLNTNIKNMGVNVDKYLEEKEKKDAVREKIELPTRATALLVGKNAQNIDKEIYMIYFNIVISIILSNLIIL
jgi:hypothetical protein